MLKRITLLVVSTVVVGLIGNISLSQFKAPTMDGKIGKLEYRNSYSNNAINMTLYWTIDGDTIYVALEAPARGWVAWGVSTDAGVDIIIGFVKDGKLTISDAFGKPHQVHKADTELGGKNDILASAASESEVDTAAGKKIFTTIEFSRKLNTNDKTDNAVIEGALKSFMAHSDADDLTTYHGKDRREDAQINYFKGTVNDF
jgi:hypothetical protein